MLITFPETEPAWALRAYLVLIGCAYRGETITYGELDAILSRQRVVQPQSVGSVTDKSH